MKPNVVVSIIVFCIICFVVLLTSCSDNDNGPTTTQNLAPSEPSDPSPADSAVDQSIDVELCWVCSDPDDDNDLSFSIYLGTTPYLEMIACGVQKKYNNRNNEIFYSPGNLDYCTKYYWKIIAVDGYHFETEGPIWNFTTVVDPSPATPFNPSPENNAIDQPLDVDLSWSCSDPNGDPLTYDICFGTNPAPPIVTEGQAETTFEPGDLNYNQLYYWKIIAKDDQNHSTSGDIWRFETASNQPPAIPSNPSPTDSAINQDIDVNLNWSSFDPDGDPLLYDIYFGTTEDIPIVSEGQTETFYDPGQLDPGQKYYWQVVVCEVNGFPVEGPLWSFTTLNRPPTIPSDPFPPHESDSQPNNIILSWSCSDPEEDPLTYDVLLRSDDGGTVVYEDHDSTSLDPGLLNGSTFYHWMISAKDDFGNSVEGPVWSFCTIVTPAMPGSPSPQDGAINQPIDVNLFWSCDERMGNYRYDIFLGTSVDPPILAWNLWYGWSNPLFFDPGVLLENTVYHWKIVVRNELGSTSIGPVWQFRVVDYVVEEREFELIDGLNITMVWIPAGEFNMGSLSIGSDYYERPKHLVTINNGFWMGKYEVTQSQWESVTGENPAHDYGIGDNRPVYFVSWDDIHNQFLDSVNDGFRLPSESEWEYACRAGTDTRFYWGDDHGYREAEGYAWFDNDFNFQAWEVGQKQHNPWGLYDMSGNVWEWCEDDFHWSYENAPDDGSPWIDVPRAEDRVVRGGSSGHPPGHCRSAKRGYYDHYANFQYYGFRLVLDR